MIGLCARCCAKVESCMRPGTAEWVAKAQADFASMRRETSVDQSPNYDVICLLAQQCVEKYLKALLCEEGIAFPKTHDLNKLAALLPIFSSCRPGFAPMLARMVGYSVGTISLARAAKAALDGYTALQHHIGMSTAQLLERRNTFDQLNGFEYIGEEA